MVGVCVGAKSLRVVLVDSLDLGHDVYAFHARLRVPAGAGTARLAGMARLGAIRCALRDRGAGQSHDAHISSHLRALDLAAAISPGSGIDRWNRDRFCRLLGGAVAMARPQLRGLWTLSSSRRFRPAIPLGQWSLRRGYADAVPAAASQQTGVGQIPADGRIWL